MTTEEEIKAEYTSSLADLTFNSKPLINVLTMLAEENLHNAKVIVEAIEEHLAKVATDVKLPILYLIDCIVKNVGRTYTTLFSQNIVATFCSVFKMVDEKTRSEMFKLRQTWNDVFPQMKLYAIDVQISTIDPAWPVTAHPSNSIHLNPKFLKNSTPPSKGKIPVPTEVPLVKQIPADIDKETLLMQEQLIQKQKELLELQKKTLELEVLQTKVKLQEQFKSGAAPPITTNILLKPEVAKQLLPETMTKTRPVGMSSSIMNQRLQSNMPTQPRINPVTPALASARPIRDPRLLRQQQKIGQNKPLLPGNHPSSSTVPAQKTAVLENNKNISNKLGVRDIPKDPRLTNKFDKKSKTFPKSREPSNVPESPQISQQKPEKSPRKSDVEKPDSSPKLGSHSSSSSLGSSGSSTSGSPTKNKNRNANKLKKRDRSEGKRSQDVDISSRKREKLSPKNDSSNSFDRNSTSDVSTFKSVKNSTKNRNYMRRNARDSPLTLQDEDLRALPLSENSSRGHPDDAAAPDQSVPEIITPAVNNTMDVDLRQLPQLPTVGKKRSSTESSEQASKKSRSFDVLFGSEDTDLRQLAVPEPERKSSGVQERPPTPPPPIISSAPTTSDKDTKQTSPRKAELDAVRAKLANATSRDKIMAKSFHKNKIQQDSTGDLDLRLTKLSPAIGLKRKITISPEEEKVIKSGQLTKEQEKNILNKIFMQIEKDKLREAKIKDKEESLGDISLQPISDDELGSDPDDREDSSEKQSDSRSGPMTTQIPPPPMPFNDKDERLNIHMAGIPPMPNNMDNIPPVHPPFFPRGDVRRHPYRGGNQMWRGGRGRMPQPRQPIRPWLHQDRQLPMRWRNPGPFVPPPDDESSRSPGQDYGPLEGPVLQDEIKTLNIDGVPRDIRVYENTAIIFLSWDDPREISFQNGARRVIFNNKESYLLTLGEDYQECLVNGYAFNVKLGVPSRELFINGNGFECFFGGPPIHVTIDGINVAVALDGPPPQVKISDTKRIDLVVGKIKLIVNAKLIVPVFLDSKLQTFYIDGKPCTLKFVDALKRVLINDVPFNVEFGGLPKPFTVHGKKHYLRFSVLPKGVKPGFVKIRDMEGEASASPIRDEEEDGFAGPLELEEPLRPDVSKVARPSGTQSPDNRSNSPSIFNNILQPGLNNLDVISNVFSNTAAPGPATGGYQVELTGAIASSDKEGAPNQQVPPAAPLLNINELFQKLVESGFVKTKESKNDDKQDSEINSIISTTVSTIANSVTITTPALSFDTMVSNGKGPQLSAKKQDPVPAAAKPQKRNLTEILRPVLFTRPETLKIRQAPLYSTLYSGMQCSSCGMRFSPESSMLYSQHLDWHFRQNRKGKKNARVANSRRWYYSLGDWKNYEEIEDLEEREKNYFDQQQQAEVAEEGEEEAEIPTVPADPNSTDEKCCVCRDAFEQFFNEEKEEWHLRNAIKVDDKTYHPVCYEDHQKSILEVTLDDSQIEEEPPQPQNKLIPGLSVILDVDDSEDEDVGPTTPNEIVSLADEDDLKAPADSPESKEDPQEDGDDDGDDDDVILNEVAPIKIVVDDDDDEHPIGESNSNGQTVPVKKEKHVEDDGFVDLDDVGLISLNNVGQIKIKTEPVDKDENETSIMDASTISDVSEAGGEPQIIEVDPAPSRVETVTSHPQLITSIDGNVELVSTSSSLVPTTISGGAKIKINISKPLPVITPKENNDLSDSSELKSSEFVMEEPEILRYKPSLQNVPLKKLPAVKKGTELTGLCSIM